MLTLAYGTDSLLPAIFFFAFVGGALGSTSFSAIHAYVGSMNLSNDKRTKFNSQLEVADHLGTILGSLTAASLVSLSSYRVIFILDASAFFLFSILVYFLSEKSDDEKVKVGWMQFCRVLNTFTVIKYF